MGAVSDRAALESEWLHLTRAVLPALAAARGWPVRRDHCFQRLILDAVFGGVWYEHVARRPAYRELADGKLAAAVGLAQAFADDVADLPDANARSLAWRAARRRGAC